MHMHAFGHHAAPSLAGPSRSGSGGDGELTKPKKQAHVRSGTEVVRGSAELYGLRKEQLLKAPPIPHAHAQANAQA